MPAVEEHYHGTLQEWKQCGGKICPFSILSDIQKWRGQIQLEKPVIYRFVPKARLGLYSCDKYEVPTTTALMILLPPRCPQA